MLECKMWHANYTAYGFDRLQTQIKKHPLQRECIDYLIHEKIFGFKEEKKLLEKGNVQIAQGKDFSDFTYLITFQKNLKHEEKALVFIHELTHIHYLHVQQCSDRVEELISKEAKRFYNQHQNFSQKKLEYATKKLWTDFSKKNLQLQTPYIAYPSQII